MLHPKHKARHVGVGRQGHRRTTGLRWAVITFLLLGLTAQAALAQQAAVPRVGILSPYAVSGSSFQDDVKRRLTELGYIEGATVAYETRFADGRIDRLPTLATDLVRFKMDVIVTTTAPGVRAAMRATTAVPIVIGGVDDAVEQGFVASLAKPGGNLTGTSWLNVELSKKRLDLMKQALPSLSRVAVLREAVGAEATARAAMKRGLGFRCRPRGRFGLLSSNGAAKHLAQRSWGLDLTTSKRRNVGVVCGDGRVLLQGESK